MTLAPVLTAEEALVHGLVAIPSLSGQEGDAVGWLVERMTELGLTSSTDGAGNAVGVLGHGSPQTVLLGHIDTVPGDLPVRVEDGVLHGRGAVDAKGALAAFVSAAARLARRDDVRGQVVVVGCVEEEASSSKGAHHALAEYAPDFCIVGEPSDWRRVTLGYKGSLRLRARLAVPCGHSAHQRRTAAETMVAFWRRVEGWASDLTGHEPRVFDQLQPTLLHLNTASDGRTETSVAELHLRLPPAHPPGPVLEGLRGLAADLPALTLEVLGQCPAFQTDRTSPLVRTFTRAIRAQGEQPGLVLKTGTADLNVVGPVWGCPVVAYGPGDAALDHTPHERLCLAEYGRAVDVLESVLAELHR
ncbi:[LysW]-lysine hydrolase [Deinococcus sp. SDU3-2]|uniref:[LysW]-lysine hydrolase n=1 Tax=Deinococcus terrestris TaxID=2651870 RepID=A0A7X1NV97_9DEIO|nr:[LysW]-lysine hydrolase [Deinococcus terrestris]MPY66437.1 [LysW]-lysine hydrolase [Deinococcus terrestris]